MKAIVPGGRLILLLPLLLAACTTETGDTPPPAETVTETVTADTPAPVEETVAVTADRDALLALLGHHRQVMQRSGMIVDRPGVPAEVTAFARDRLQNTGPLIGELNELIDGPRDGGALRQQEREALLRDGADAYVGQMRTHITQILPFAEHAAASADAEVAELGRGHVEKLTAQLAELEALAGGAG